MVILIEPGSAGVPVLAGWPAAVTAIGWRVDNPSVDVVRTSDEEGMRHVVDPLVHLGHHAIPHIDGGTGPTATSRRRAYRAAMRRHGLDQNSRVTRGGDSLAARWLMVR